MPERKPELAPCPFCGRWEPVLTDCQELQACETWKRCPAVSHYKAVVCSIAGGGCGASSGFWPTDEEAVRAWNRRAELEAVHKWLNDPHQNDWMHEGEG